MVPFNIGDLVRLRRAAGASEEGARVGIIYELDEDGDPVVFLSSEVPRFYVYKTDIARVLSHGSG